MAASDIATEGQIEALYAAIAAAIQERVPPVVGFWDSGQSRYERADATPITSHVEGVPLVLYGGTIADRDAQSWLPAAGWAHHEEVLTP